MENKEPRLEDIDDFNDNETPEKRKTVRLIIISLLVAGAIFAYIKESNSVVLDYVGTEDNPGINIKGK